MSKTSKNKRGPQVTRSVDAHSHIVVEASQLCKAARTGLQGAEVTPAISAMLGSARAALEQGTPKSFEHEGRTYWLRVAFPMTRMSVFDTPTSFSPVVRAVCGSGDEFGHKPGH